MLDIGCGPGQLAIRLAGHRPGLHVSGVDLDPAMIARAWAHAAREFALDDPAKPTFLVGDVDALPFAERSFDLAVSTFSLHHWSDPVAGFAELYRVLRPGGLALIWDIAGHVRRIETTAQPIELARQSPFGAAEIGGRWSLGPLVLGERYDPLRPAIEQPTVEAGSNVTPITRRRSRPAPDRQPSRQLLWPLRPGTTHRAGDAPLIRRGWCDCRLPAVALQPGGSEDSSRDNRP